MLFRGDIVRHSGDGWIGRVESSYRRGERGRVEVRPMGPQSFAAVFAPSSDFELVRRPSDAPAESVAPTHHLRQADLFGRN